jgi:heptosyltransferase-2
MNATVTTPPRRLLIRGVNWLGDAVMTTPALLRLRERFPGTHLTLLTPEKLRDLWLHHPAVNETIGFAPGDGLLGASNQLRAGEFDLALVLPNSPRSALEVFLAGIPRRIGYARPWRSQFLTAAVPPRTAAVTMHKRTRAEVCRLVSRPPAAQRPPAAYPPAAYPPAAYPPAAHQTHEYLHLAAALGANPEPLAPLLVVTPEEVAAARIKFGLQNPGRPVFGLNPGAEYGPAKRWPVEKFIAAAQEIQRQTDCVWILFGGKSDAVITDQIESAIGSRQPAVQNLAGKTSLRELMSLLKLCRVLLTNDTGPMHVAAALGTPVVVPFGSTSPELTGPGQPGDSRHQLLKSDAPCSPCFLRDCPIDFRCLNGISAGRLVEAVIQALR